MRDAGTQLDPAFLQFRAQLWLLTCIDEEELTRWMVRHRTQLREGFARSRRPRDEVRVWVREQFIRSQGVRLDG